MNHFDIMQRVESIQVPAWPSFLQKQFDGALTRSAGCHEDGTRDTVIDEAMDMPFTNGAHIYPVAGDHNPQNPQGPLYRIPEPFHHPIDDEIIRGNSDFISEVSVGKPLDKHDYIYIYDQYIQRELALDDVATGERHCIPPPVMTVGLMEIYHNFRVEMVLLEKKFGIPREITKFICNFAGIESSGKKRKYKSIEHEMWDAKTFWHDLTPARQMHGNERPGRRTKFAMGVPVHVTPVWVYWSHLPEPQPCVFSEAIDPEATDMSEFESAESEHDPDPDYD